MSRERSMDRDEGCPLSYLEPSTLSCHIFYVRLDRQHETVEACAHHARRRCKVTATTVALQEGGDTRQIRARNITPARPYLGGLSCHVRIHAATGRNAALRLVFSKSLES